MCACVCLQTVCVSVGVRVCACVRHVCRKKMGDQDSGSEARPNNGLISVYTRLKVTQRRGLITAMISHHKKKTQPKPHSPASNDTSRTSPTMSNISQTKAHCAPLEGSDRSCYSYSQYIFDVPYLSGFSRAGIEADRKEARLNQLYYC